MAVLHRFIVLVPMILSFIAFILTILALTSGHQKGFMEEYAVLRLNTSMIGQDLLQSDSKSGSSSDDDDDDDDGSLLDKFKHKIHDLGDDAKGKIGDIAGDIIGDIADEIGIKDWYSLHLMSFCQGYFGANATAAHYSLNTTNCTTTSFSNRFNLTDMLNTQLSQGPLGINVGAIKLPDSVQSKIAALNAALLALFVFYVLGVSFSGLSVLACIPAFVLEDKKLVLFANTVLAALAATTITLGSIVVTAATSIAATDITSSGKTISLVAVAGTKFYIITWIAAVFMMIVTLFWVGKFALLRKREKKHWERYSKERF